MKLRIAIIDNQLTRQLIDFDKINSSVNQIIVLSEEKAAEYLISNRVDIALVTAIGYNSAVDKCDLRIVPTSALSLEGYTNVLGVYFKPNLRTIENIAFNTDSPIINTLALSAIAEKFDIAPAITANADACALVDWTDNQEKDPALDLSEEWTDGFSFKMPLYFWAVRNDEYEADIANAIKEIELEQASSSLEIADGSEEDRQGRISFVFDEEFENALDETLELLYCRQAIHEIGAVKVLGRDGDDEEL